MRRLMANFQTLTEFGQYHGDCGELATLAALHPLDPARWPLTLATLNQMVADEIKVGDADPALSGGQNIPHLDDYLRRMGIEHTTYCSYAGPLPGNAPFKPFSLDELHIELKMTADPGLRLCPDIIEWANGGALPGDESGVRYHYSAKGGVDTGPNDDGNPAHGAGYLFADGDNRASGATPGDPIRYTWLSSDGHDVVHAQPCGYIAITQHAVVPPYKPVVIELTAAQIAAVKAS